MHLAWSHLLGMFVRYAAIVASPSLQCILNQCPPLQGATARAWCKLLFHNFAMMRVMQLLQVLGETLGTLDLVPGVALCSCCPEHFQGAADVSWHALDEVAPSGHLENVAQIRTKECKQQLSLDGLPILLVC